jgi:hypothetical protein
VGDTQPSEAVLRRWRFRWHIRSFSANGRAAKAQRRTVFVTRSQASSGASTLRDSLIETQQLKTFPRKRNRRPARLRGLLMAQKTRTGRDGRDLVFGRTATEAFFASTIRARANKAWNKPGSSRSLRTKPGTARSPTSSRPVSTGSRSPEGPARRCPPDVETLRAPRARRRGHRKSASRRLPHTHTSDPDCDARPQERRNPEHTGVLQYRYRDSNPRFRREREIERSQPFPEVRYLHTYLKPG